MWWILWLALAVALLIVEVFTSDLVSIWFSAAAFLVGILAVIFPMLHWAWLIAIFAVLSAAFFILTRPFVRKFLKRKTAQATNLDLIVGHLGIVEEKIDNDFAKGAVKINGLIWSARSQDGEVINRDEFVVVQRIEGNKLIVIKRKGEK